jgi:hypothetical protein
LLRLNSLLTLTPGPAPIDGEGSENQIKIERKKKAGASWTPPPCLTAVVIAIDYDFLQPHLPHLQLSAQEQFLPSQLGHLQSSQPHLAVVAAETTASARESGMPQDEILPGALEQHDFAADSLAAVLQPQLPQAHSSHEQVPLQLGHAQSTQPQSAFAELPVVRLPAKANA